MDVSGDVRELVGLHEGHIMNWDITIGQVKQTIGRSLQQVGSRFAKRKLVMHGERAEYAGRLQKHYGMLKHQALWNVAPNRIPNADSNQQAPVASKKSMSV